MPDPDFMLDQDALVHAVELMQIGQPLAAHPSNFRLRCRKQGWEAVPFSIC